MSLKFTEFNDSTKTKRVNNGDKRLTQFTRIAGRTNAKAIHKTDSNKKTKTHDEHKIGYYIEESERQI